MAQLCNPLTLQPKQSGGQGSIPGSRGGASPEKVEWKRDRIDGQKLYLTIFISLLLNNEYRPEESGLDMSTPVHLVAPPLLSMAPPLERHDKGSRTRICLLSFCESSAWRQKPLLHLHVTLNKCYLLLGSLLSSKESSNSTANGKLT